jgi:hypothetical protein
MFKLLPPDTRATVEREYRMRRAVTLIFGLVIVCAVGIAGLFPTYVAFSSREAALNDEISTLSTSPNTSADNSLKSWADSVRKKLVGIAPVKDTDKPYELFTKTLAISRSGVRINGIAWHRDDKSGLSLSLAGVASTREHLLSFEQALNTSGLFKPTTFPVSDLASSADINFQFELTPAS